MSDRPPTAARLAGSSDACDHEGVTPPPSVAPVEPAAVAPATPLAPSATRSPAPTSRPAADVVMRRLLRVDGPRARLDEDELRRGFSQSILVSAVRCTFTYLLIPFLGPILGIAAGVGPWIGIPVGVVAVVFNVRSMRRFWAADHRFRWHYTVVGGLVIALLAVLMVRDLLELLG